MPLGVQITLQADQPVTVFWDEFRIERVLINLLTNTARHGNAQPGTIELTALADFARIDIRDQGLGHFRAGPRGHEKMRN